MDRPNPREIALNVLRRTREGQFVEHLLEAALGENSLSPADRRLCQEIVYGITRWQSTLDWLARQKTANETQKPVLAILLRMGLYQIFWLDRIPAHAAVNETVALARRAGFGPQAGFINAVLRNFAREADITRKQLIELRRTQPHLGYSHPQWLVERWTERWGREAAIKLLEWNNTAPKVYARVNTLKTAAEKLLPQWRDENVEYDFVRRPWLEENLVFELKAHPPLNHLPSFKAGLFYVQDPSTLLAPALLEAKPDQAILDLCAAPGGKLTYLAQVMENQGRLVAHDVSDRRLHQVQENCVRLGITCAELVTLERLQAQASFDRVLVDAPCSNTGVMRRRVELRWRVQPEEIKRLQRAQMELLAVAARHVKPNGLVVYSTCSLEPEENSEVVQAFLAANPGWSLECEKELIPFRDEVDGAFVAVLHPPNFPAQ